ncbi:hybrid sensor histidine kinase/response regulator [Streptomyces iconiensis]|uniref:PAS domain-containing protein n=1 Tax=Streptomyces iconiensis TaxID=1384038 RepID=A0ABT6ZRU5_9ACTN|nr:PAS domain-containing protein [Streptomyces iconiensis]MDJ1131759.1 PAS domain-containing protein [Streptomyces iconiensis]
MSSRPSRGAARLAAILDALPDALLLVNCNGTVVNANTIALEAFETPGTALVGRGLLDLLPEFDSKRIPGSMRRPEEAVQTQERQKPTRMVARRTDGTEFPVEVTSANLEDGRTPYASAFDAAFADHGTSHGSSYTGDELLMLVVRDLTGTLDTEAELARQQRQTEMILRAASEGVVGVDAEGRVVLVNPAAAQILGYRANDLGGQELHPLVHHSRPDGTPLPYEETPLADTLRSGRKHRVRVGQTLWAKDGHPVPVDMTTAPVRDGDQLVGAVLTFTDRRPYDALVARQEQLRAVLEDALRGPLDQLRGELTGLAADPAGQLWPEANQILRHLSAGYARMTTLVDNVLHYQRLDSGQDRLSTESVPLDAVVAAGVDGAVELIGPGRAQFAVHAPPIEAEVDPERLAVALAHLIADVAGVDATGRTPVAPPPGVDPTIVVAAAQRGEVVRIEVRGPHHGGSPVHAPLVRGIIARHGGVLQTHDVPGAAGGSAYVLEVPVASADPSSTRQRTAGHARRGGTDSGTGGGAPSSGGDTGGGGTGGGGTGTAAGDGNGAEGRSNGGAGTPRSEAQASGETTVMPVPSAPARGTEGHAQVQDGDGAGGQGRQGDGRGDDQARGQGQGPGQEQGPGQGQALQGRGLELGPGQGAAPGGGAGEQRGDDGAQGQARALEPALGQVPDPRQSRELGPVRGQEQGPGPGQGPRPEQGSGPGQGSVPGQGRAALERATSQGRAGTAMSEQPHMPAQGHPGRPELGPAATPQAPAHAAEQNQLPPAQVPAQEAPHSGDVPRPTGRRRGRPSPGEEQHEQTARADEDDTLGGPMALPPAGGSANASVPAQSSGRRARRALADPAEGRGEAAAEASVPEPQSASPSTSTSVPMPPPGQPGQSGPSGQGTEGAGAGTSQDLELQGAAGGGRRARRIAAAKARAQAEAEAQQGPQHAPFALPPAPSEPQESAAAAEQEQPGMGSLNGVSAPASQGGGADSGGFSLVGAEAPGQQRQAGAAGGAGQQEAEGERRTADHSVVAASPILGGPPPQQPEQRQPGHHQSGHHQPPPHQSEQHQSEQHQSGQHQSGQSSAQQGPGQGLALPERGATGPYGADQGPLVRTLGQGLPVPFSERTEEQAAHQWHGQLPSPASPASAIPSTPSTPPPPAGSGRRRKLSTPPEKPEGTAPGPEQAGNTGPGQGQGQGQGEGQAPAQSQTPPGPLPGPMPGPMPMPQPASQNGTGPQRFAVGASVGPSMTEGPEPLDGPDSPIEVTDGRGLAMPPHARDDELPPEPLDNPRRLLVWPEPDVSTQQALSDRGYRPVLVHSREEVDAQIAAYPAALFVDPLTGPITRTALQSLRTAAVAAEVPVLVTAGLGQATREAAYGADPAVLLKALAPRDSEQHPPRVLLVEEHHAIASAFATTLERRGMQVARAPTDAEAVNLAAQMRPNLVVMDLMQVRRRRAGIIDWLRVNGLLNRTPFVVYTSADMDPNELPRLASGETVLFLAERSTSVEVQSRIVDLLTKIGAS